MKAKPANQLKIGDKFIFSLDEEFNGEPLHCVGSFWRVDSNSCEIGYLHPRSHGGVATKRVSVYKACRVFDGANN